MSAVPHCVVVIPTYDGAHLLSTCLAALLAHPPEGCQWRAIVVDDASSDGTAERFAGYDDRVTVVARERNGGFAAACNDGARAAGDVDYLVFLNNDTIPLPGWLDALVEEVEAHPEAAAVGSKLLFPDGSVQHAGVTIGHDRWPHHIYAGFPGEHPAVNHAREVAAVTAACALVRRSAFERMGGFDTDFHNGYEDIDLCLRLAEEGQRVRYCPRSVLYHLESVTRWADESTRHTGHNDRLYEERWLGRVVPDDVAHYLADGLISVDYGAAYPVQMSISPLLATVRRETEPADRLELLLSARTEEVMTLRSRLTRAMLEGQRQEIAPPTSSSRPLRTGGSPEVVSAGEFHRLGAGGGTRVSILMPLMDAADALRETLPLLLEQEADAELEIVAVDSASTDETIAVLEGFDATVLTIDPSQFDHGLTRNFLAEHARGDVLVFLNGRSRPCDRDWLRPLLATLASDPTIAGACSRVLPYPDADPLTRRDGELEPSGSVHRVVRRIEDRRAWDAMEPEQRRVLMNFHTVSAAIRAEAMARFPFKSVRAIGEDLLWAREVLEAGLALAHEAGSRVYHSHDYSLKEWLMRNVDDGIANHDINGRSISEQEVDQLVRGMVASDWSYLRGELDLEGDELQRWEIQSALRRAAQGAGQWLGANHEALPPEAVIAFSRVENSRRGGG
jgi:GT2 family glycosyltransferase